MYSQEHPTWQSKTDTIWGLPPKSSDHSDLKACAPRAFQEMVKGQRGQTKGATELRTASYICCIVLSSRNISQTKGLLGACLNSSSRSSGASKPPKSGKNQQRISQGEMPVAGNDMMLVTFWLKFWWADTSILWKKMNAKKKKAKENKDFKLHIWLRSTEKRDLDWLSNSLYNDNHPWRISWRGLGFGFITLPLYLFLQTQGIKD